MANIFDSLFDYGKDIYSTARMDLEDVFNTIPDEEDYYGERTAEQITLDSEEPDFIDRLFNKLKEKEKKIGDLEEAKVPVVKPISGTLPSLLGLSQGGPSYRGTPSPYTYGQIPTSLKTPAQLQQEAAKGIQDFLNMAIVAAPRMNFRGLI